MALRLLVVEDDQNIADLVMRIAGEVGFITQHSNGNQLKKVYQQFQPDIIVLDIIMPDMDGIEVLQYLKDQHKRLRIILLSGSPDSYRSIAHSLGQAVGFTIEASIAKPFRVGELREVLKHVLSGNKANPPDNGEQSGVL